MIIENVSKTYVEKDFITKNHENNTEKRSSDIDNINITKDDAIIFDSMPREELEHLSFQADIVDEIKAIEYNEIQESGKLATEDIIAAAVENISDLANGSIEKFNIAITFVENSMQENPNNANETKQGIVSLIREKIDYLTNR